MTITDVTLREADGLELIDAVLAPVHVEGTMSTLVGSRHGWPPGGPEDTIGVPPTWADAVPAIGTTVEPGAEWNLVVGLATTAPMASAAAITVGYEDESGRRFEAPHRTEITVRPDCGAR